VTHETAIDRVTAAMDRHGIRWRRTAGGNLSAKCPVHDGNGNTSLGVRGVEGRALMLCRSGVCTAEDIVAALGLSMSDLFDEPGGQEYRYTDAAGQRTRTVHRSPDKGFRQSGRTSVRQLYRLPRVLEAVTAGQPVYLVEGEQDVHTLESLGVVATTAPEGAGRIGKCDLAPLKGAVVVAIPDRDAAGEKWAATVRERLGGGYTKSLTFAQPKDGKDVTDHVLLGHGLAELVSVDGVQWDDPLPFGWRPSALPAFPVDALPRVIGNYVSALAEATQTPIDLPGVVALGIQSACVGGRVEVEPRRGWTEPTNLYTVAVLPPGSRKSAVVGACRVPLDSAWAQLVDELGPTVLDSRTEKDIRERYANRCKEQAAKESDPALIAEAQDAVRAAEQVVVPPWPKLTTDDATPEALVTALAEQGGRVAAISAEAGIFDSLTGRYTKGANLEPVLKAHAGDMIQVDRRGRAPETVHAPALTMIATIQPYALQEMLNRPDFAGRGLLARILWVLAPDTVGYRKVDAEAVPVDTEKAYRTTVEALAVAMAKRDSTVRLAVSEPAGKRLNDYAARVERMLRPDAELGAALLRQWGSKLVGAAVRIAGCLHATEHALTDPISETTMVNAIRLAEYCRAHATAALATRDDERTRNTRAVIALLVDKEMTTFRLRDLQRKVPREMQKADLLKTILRDLADGGWVRERADSGSWDLHPDAGQHLHPADTADTADTGGETAGQARSTAVSTAADTADTSGHSVSSVSMAADTVETPLTRGYTPAVSGVSSVSSGDCPTCSWPFESVGHDTNCLRGTAA